MGDVHHKAQDKCNEFAYGQAQYATYRAVRGGRLPGLRIPQPDITFNDNFGSEEDPIGQLSVTSATIITIVSPFDVTTPDVGLFNMSGTVDFGDTLVVLGDGNVSVLAGSIFGDLSAANAASVTVVASVLGDIKNLLIVNTAGMLSFNAGGGVIEGNFGAGGLEGFLGAQGVWPR